MQLKSIVTAILNAVDAGRAALAAYNAAIVKARPAFAGKSQDEVRDALLPIVAAYRGVPIVDGRGKAEGRKVFQRTDADGNKCAGFESAKADLRRIVQDIMGEASPDKAPSAPTKVRVKADERAAALALLEACGGDLKRAQAILKAVA